jgi:DNA modification methylase
MINVTTTPTIEPNSIINGDCIEVLKQLPDNSVDCCVTSPPYLGLRDYGTSTWEGGSLDCDHVADPTRTKKFGNPEFNQNRPSREETKIDGYYYKDICEKCGAKRIDKQIGLEFTMKEYLEKLTVVFREIRRVLKPSGTLWLNLGDSYAGSGKGMMSDGSIVGSEMQKTNKGSTTGTLTKTTKELPAKNLLGIPWRVAFALQDDGWILRQDIIWAKGVSGDACKHGWSGNPMPESVQDRCSRAHEYIFLFSKKPKYYFNNDAIKEPSVRAGDLPGGQNHFTWSECGGHNKDGLKELGKRHVDEMRNRRDVWTIAVKGNNEKHYASYPRELITPCILAGCPEGGTVLDPFFGSGTTGIVAMEQNKNFIGIELSPEYVKIAENRIKKFYDNELDFCLMD